MMENEITVPQEEPSLHDSLIRNLMENRGYHVESDFHETGINFGKCAHVFRSTENKHPVGISLLCGCEVTILPLKSH